MIPKALEGAGGDAFPLVDEPEKDVLGADVIVVEEACLFLGEDHDPSCSVGEAFEQVWISSDRAPTGVPRVYRSTLSSSGGSRAPYMVIGTEGAADEAISLRSHRIDPD